MGERKMYKMTIIVQQSVSTFFQFHLCSGVTSMLDLSTSCK